MPQFEIFIITVPSVNITAANHSRARIKQKWASKPRLCRKQHFPKKPIDFEVVKSSMNSGCSVLHPCKLKLLSSVRSVQALITQTRAKQAATMSEVEWRGRTVPVKIDKVRIFLLGLADNEAAIAQVTQQPSPSCPSNPPLSFCAIPGTWTKSSWVISFFSNLGLEG